MTAAWGNRMGSPEAKDKQAMLDEVDKQLADIGVSKEERASITKPYVRMIAFDFYSWYVRLFDRYLNWKLDDLRRRYSANNTPELKDALQELNIKGSAWRSRAVGDTFGRISPETLVAELEIAKPNDWLDAKEATIADRLRGRVVRMVNECVAKGGFTNEVADFYDRYKDLGGQDRMIKEVFGVEQPE